MSNLPPFKRHQEGARLYYDVLSSNGFSYYEVEMLGNVAISCECKAGGYGQVCKHRRTAEQAETEFQEQQRGVSTSEQLACRDRMIAASLNGSREFNLLKR